MKPILSFLTCLFILACCNIKNPETIKVVYPEIDGVSFLFSNTLFNNLEIILLETDSDIPIIGVSPNLIIKNDTYYIVDYANTKKVHLFDLNGKFINSVGNVGRGPGEYLYLTDVVFEDNGNISIFSYAEKALYTYASNGQFIQKKDCPYEYSRFIHLNEFSYYFYGHGNRSYQLYITDRHGYTIDSCLTASKALSLIAFPPFYRYLETIYLCDPLSGRIYQCKEGKIDVAYNFDFERYTIPDAYFNAKDPMESIKILTPHTFALKYRFFKAKQSAVLWAAVANLEENWTRILYGILTDNNAEWQWFYLPHNDLIAEANLAYVDDSALYFMIEPTLLKDAGLTEKFPLLDDTDENSNPVIIKCTVNAINTKD